MRSAVTRYPTYRDQLEWVLRRPLAAISAVLIVSLLFAWQIPNLIFSTSVYDLIIEDLPENGRYEEYKSVFGSDEMIRVVVKADNVFDPATYRKLEVLAEAAGRIPGVRRVISLPGIKKAVDISGDWDMKKFADVISPVALFQRNLLSDDRKTTVLTLVLENGADSNQVIDAVDKMILQAPRTLSLYQIGMPLVSQAMASYTRTDFFRLPPITFLLIATVLFLLFRNLTCLLIPLSCVSLSLVWTFGLMALTGVALSMLTMIVPVFLIAVGTAYCLHILAEYRTAVREHKTREDAVRSTFAQVTFPTALAVGTTVIGLGSLLLNRIPAIREFAVFSCFGMFSLLVLVLTLFPAALVLAPVPGGEKRGETVAPGWIDRLLSWIIDLNLHRQRTVLPIIAVVAVFCIIGIFRLRVETNPVGYFKSDTPVSRHFHDIYKDLSGSFPIYVTMAGPEADYFFEDAGRLADMVRLQAFLETLPGVDKTISYADYIKLVNYASNRFDPAYYRLPEQSWETRMLVNSFRIMLGEDMLQRFMSPDFSRTSILLLTHLSSSRDFLSIRKRILDHAGEKFPKELQWDVTGFGVVISASSHLITSGQIKSLSMTMILIFGIMFLLFLSSKVGLVAIVPNLFPIVVNFGVMGWLGIELSMFTSLIASIAIGLAVDDTIHYLFRYNREFKKDLDDRRALADTLRQIGRPILFTTMTISLGFSILVFSSFQPTSVFGLMMVITLISALVGDLVLLPSLMLHVELVTLWDLIRLKMGREPREGIPIFHGLSHTQVHYIIMAGSLRQIDTGTVLFRKGDASDSMYALISGGLDVVDHGEGEDPAADPTVGKRLNSLSSGDVLGEMGLLRGAPRSATIIATAPCELLQINLKMIKRLQWLYPPTAYKFFFNLMTILCDRLEWASHCLYENSLQDDVTGLWNRKSFMANLDREAHRSHRYHSGFSLCLLRIDSREAACAPGGELSDTAIQTLSRILYRHLRRSDLLGRLSLRTFAILLPHTPIEEARAICKRLVELLNAGFAAGGDEGLHISMGLAGLDTQMQTSGEQIYDRALAALEHDGPPG